MLDAEQCSFEVGRLLLSAIRSLHKQKKKN